MKNNQTFATQYPYLAYWIKSWGEMRIGYDYDSDYGSFLMLFDQGGTCYEGDEETTFEEAFAKAEKYLREVEFPDRFDKETIAELEKAYKNRN